jgi:hypothetical protein
MALCWSRKFGASCHGSLNAWSRHKAKKKQTSGMWCHIPLKPHISDFGHRVISLAQIPWIWSHAGFHDFNVKSLGFYNYSQTSFSHQDHQWFPPLRLDRNGGGGPTADLSSFFSNPPVTPWNTTARSVWNDMGAQSINKRPEMTWASLLTIWKLPELDPNQDLRTLYE